MRPVKMNSLARFSPMSRGSTCVPPQPGMTPTRISGWPNLAVSAAMARSLASTSSQPPPRARPLTDGDDRLGQHADGLVRTAARLVDDGVDERPRGELVDVGAGAEGLVAAAGDDDHVHVRRRGRPARAPATSRRGARRSARSASPAGSA